MIRRAFVRRMIFAGLATWFLDLPLPAETSGSDVYSGPFGLAPDTPGDVVRFRDMTVTLDDGEGGSTEVLLPEGSFRCEERPDGAYLVDIWDADGNLVHPWKAATFQVNIGGPSSYLFP